MYSYIYIYRHLQYNSICCSICSQKSACINYSNISRKNYGVRVSKRTGDVNSMLYSQKILPQYSPIKLMR